MGSNSTQLFFFRKGDSMSFTNVGFYIDGVKYDSLNISSTPYIVRNSPEINMPFIGGKQIAETRVPYSDVPHFYGTQKEPLSFNVLFSILDDQYTHSNLMQIGRIFGQDKYVSFQTEDDLDKYYYVIPNGGVNLVTYGTFKGMYELNLRANAPHAWAAATPHTISATPNTEYVINNTTNVMNPKYRDYRYYPTMTITLTGASTSMTITNLSDSNRQTTFTGLTTSEVLTIDNRLKTITSSTGNNRFTNFNKNWLYLVEGSNTLRFSSSATVVINTQYPIYA